MAEGDGNVPPIVRLDNEGSVQLTGLTIVDHFAEMSGDDHDELVAFCKRKKLPKPKSAEARAESLYGVNQPQDRFDELEKGTSPRKAPVAKPPKLPATTRFERITDVPFTWCCIPIPIDAAKVDEHVVGGLSRNR